MPIKFFCSKSLHFISIKIRPEITYFLYIMMNLVLQYLMGCVIALVKAEAKNEYRNYSA